MRKPWLKKINESDVLDLLHVISQASEEDKDGDLLKKQVGIYRGSSISPILSNIYLMEFDRWFPSKRLFFARYSDDLLVLGRSKDELTELFDEILSRFAVLGLVVSEKKTCLCALKDGIEFLGYYFDDKGKAVTAKAKNELSSRLEVSWMMQREKPCHERLQKLSEILGGWKQYFQGKEIEDILEYAAALYMTTDREKRREMSMLRWNFFNPYRELAEYLLDIWKELGDKALQVMENEQIFTFT